MNARRPLLGKWRLLEKHARRWIVSGAVALMAIIGAGVAAVIKDEVKDWTNYTLNYVIGLGKITSCEFRRPAQPANSDLPVILFPRLEDDPEDKIWRSIFKILYDETAFDVVPSCVRFTTTTSSSMKTARAQFLRTMDSQIKAIHADMLLFGTVSASRKVKIWSANSLGDCDWQSTSVDLDDPAAAKKVFTLTRSSLLGVIVKGLTAACNSEPADWRAVAKIVGIVSPYLDKRRAMLNAPDYYDAELHLFALSYARYANVGEEFWFLQAKRAAEAVIALASTTKANLVSTTNNSELARVFRGQLGLLYWRKFKKSNSSEALKQSIAYFQAMQQADGRSWSSLLSTNGDAVVPALKAALKAGFDGVTAAEIEQARSASADLAITNYSPAIRSNGNDAEAYNSRGDAYKSIEDFDRAISDYGRAILLDPKNAEYLNSRCWARAIAGRDLSQALDDCNESLRLRPNNSSILNSRGLAHFKLGAFDRAIADYEAAVNKDPMDAGSRYARGIARLKTGDTAGGEADIAAAKAIEGDIADVYAEYGVK